MEIVVHARYSSEEAGESVGIVVARDVAGRNVGAGERLEVAGSADVEERAGATERLEFVDSAVEGEAGVAENLGLVDYVDSAGAEEVARPACSKFAVDRIYILDGGS